MPKLRDVDGLWKGEACQPLEGHALCWDHALSIPPVGWGQGEAGQASRDRVDHSTSTMTQTDSFSDQHRCCICDEFVEVDVGEAVDMMFRRLTMHFFDRIEQRRVRDCWLGREVLRCLFVRKNKVTPHYVARARHEVRVHLHYVVRAYVHVDAQRT